MRLGRVIEALGLAATPAIVFGFLLIPSVSQAQSPRVFGQGAPFAVEDLPAGPVRTRLEQLPAPARERAVAWLQTFTFPEKDLEALEIDPEGGVFYADRIPLPDPEAGAPAQAGAPGVEAATPAEILSLHSRPGAPNVAYLDFDGHTITGTAWNNSTGTDPLLAKPFDKDGNPGSFGSGELNDIHEIWHRVAEDLAPYEIDVTTELPASFDSRTARILVTRDEDENGATMPSAGGGGVAYVNVFAGGSYAYYSPALVYYDNLSSSPTNIAEASSHELGHNLALSHDGTSSQTYYPGHGSGFVSWAPIMGNSYSRNVTQWSKGEYSGANNQQDDLAIIDGKLGYRPDDHGDDTLSATPLVVDGNGNILVTNPETDPGNASPENKGVIDLTSDVDFFFFDASAGPVNIAVTPAWDAFYRTSRRGANLDIHAALYDQGGALVAQSDPIGDTDALLSASITGGRYYIGISGVGNASTPYSDYDSLGQYFILGAVPAMSCAEPLDCDDTSVCTVEDCVSQVCVFDPIDCGDGDACTVDSCDPVSGCQQAPLVCDDGLFCNGTETCDVGSGCVAGTDPCPGQTCNEALEACVMDPEGFLLSRNSDFSTDDRTFFDDETLHMLLFSDQVDFNDIRKLEWQLKSGPKVEGNLTNHFDGTYTAAYDLTNLPNDNESWDWKGKAEDESGNKYQPETEITVLPAPPCLTDPDCSDGIFCNGAEICDPVLGCLPSLAPVDCDDGVSCTIDSCNETTSSCDWTPNDAVCDDGVFCNGAETCGPSGCQPSTDPCPAGLACSETTQACHPRCGLGFELGLLLPALSLLTGRRRRPRRARFSRGSRDRR